MRKQHYSAILLLYAISFTPFTDSVAIDGARINAEHIRSNLGPQTLYQSAYKDFSGALFNTTLLNLPAHYGAFISIIDVDLGNRFKSFSFSNRFKKPSNTGFGWTLGLLFGWGIRILLLVYLIKLTWKTKY